MRLRAPLVTGLALACTLACAQERDVKLPDIGSSAAAILSPQELRDYGAGMLRELRGAGFVLDDPLVADQVAAIGWRLVANSPRPQGDFTFFVVQDESINAFAAPGGYIGVNAGLITAMASEDELAGVLAHEIAHVQQEHILRAFEDQKKMSIPVMLGMLGVILATAGRSDDAAAAAMVTGTSLIQQRQIDFTRTEEAEADRVGIQTLARAGYDPAGMAGAFATLQKVMRVNGVDIPEFLMTHPLDTKRIAEAKARAAQLEGTATRARASRRESAHAVRIDPGLLPVLQAPATPARTAAPAQDEEGFALMRERVRVLAAKSPTAIRGYYADNLRTQPGFDTVPNRYGFALALVRAREPGAAVTELKALAAKRPDSATVRLGLAHAQDQAGDRAAARATYDRLVHDFPGNRAIALGYGEALLASAEADASRKAIALLQPLVERHPDDPDLQRGIARADQLSGDKIRAAEAYAEAAWLTGHAEDAMQQLQRLVGESDLTYYQRSRIEARITRLTPEVLELRRQQGAPTPEKRINALR